MSAASDILKLIKEKEIEFVDLRFTDPRGKLQHMTQDLTTIDEGFLNDGTFFDGSSITQMESKELILIESAPCVLWVPELQQQKPLSELRYFQ